MKADVKTMTESYGELTELSKDRSGRFGNDAELRRHGYRISSRPKDGHATWEKNGRVYTEEVAVRRVQEAVLKEKGG